MDLVEFLRARIAEDRAWARQQERAAVRGHHLGRTRPQPPGHWSRVLVECEAKLSIVEEYELLAASPDDRAGQRATLRWVLEHIAAAYAGHPEYRDEWRP
jgi:hypothetical protein